MCIIRPQVKGSLFTNAALIRAKRLLLSIMRAITQGDLLASSTSVANDNDDEEDVPIRKKNSLWDSFDELKKKKSADLSTNQDKDEKEMSSYCSAEYIERRRILWHGGRKT